MDNLQEIIDIFAETTDKNEMRKLFSELFTASEEKDIAKRWYIMKELYKGTPQRHIAQDMEVSLCKITRGSRILKDEESAFRKILGNMFDETHL